MYKFRFRFITSKKGFFKSDDSRIDFILFENKESSLNAESGKSISESTVFVIVSDGYETQEESYQAGLKIKDAILLYATKFRIGIDIGKDKASSFVVDSIKKKIFDEHKVLLIDDVHGLSTYISDYKTQAYSLTAELTLNSKEASFFVDELNYLLDKEVILNDKLRNAITLFCSSNLQSNFILSRFLYLIFCTESLVETVKRDEKTQSIVKQLEETVSKADIIKSEKASLLKSISFLYNKSIGQGLKALAETLGDKKYANMSAKKFIRKCYDARSSLVHDGFVDEKEFDLPQLVGALETFTQDILKQKIATDLGPLNHTE